MLRQKDPATLESFTKWFGKYDSKAKHTILERIRNHLIMLKRLTHHNFYEITNLEYRRKAYSVVYPDDHDSKIALGHHFWQAPSTGVHSKAGKLIQAFSHFSKAGSLKDYAIGDKSCLALVAWARYKALHNAENFARFIES